MLRYKADIRTIIYMLAITTSMVVLMREDSFLSETWNVLLWAFLLVFSISSGVMVHNHKHVPMWKSKVMNTITDCWLTILYGYPVFGWIPTHLQNHHLHTNKEEDYTKTYAYSEKNNLLTILYYPMYSGGIQQKAIVAYMKQLYRKDNQQFWSHLLQIVVLISFLISAFAISWKNALLYVVLPQQIALNSVLFFNYLQHIHADEDSEYNHSRNITGWFLNAFLFNNGFHTAHHVKPHLHWSRTPEFHHEIEPEIDPRLNEKVLIWFLIKQYLVAPFNSRFGTKSMRENRIGTSS